MKKLFFTLITMSLMSVLNIKQVMAQTTDDFGLNDLTNSNIALEAAPIQETIVNIINIFLGFLGILAVLLIIYGGFLWMTSRGNTEKVEQAKMLLASAVIGLVIIISAFAIAKFVFDNMLNAINDAGLNGEEDPPIDDPSSECLPPTDSSQAKICSLSSYEGLMGSTLIIRGYNFDTNGNNNPDTLGRVVMGSQDLEIIECLPDEFMWKNREIRVRIPNNLTADTDYTIEVFNDLGNKGIETSPFVFHIGTGESLVNINCLVPDNGSAGVATAVQILGNGFTNSENTISMSAWDEVNDQLITLENVSLDISNWTNTKINMTVPIDAISSDIIVAVGEDSASEYFTINCAEDGDCTSGCCSVSTNSCQDISVCNEEDNLANTDPVITSITPSDGAAGNLITIQGYNFGVDVGNINFYYNDQTEQGIVPSSLNSSCLDTWEDNYIIIGVPNNLSDVDEQVDITVINSDGVESVSEFFDKNTTIRPGICTLNPEEGKYTDEVIVQGINFGSGDEAYFDNMVSYHTDFNSATQITTEVPNVIGDLDVIIKTSANVDSNPWPFSALSIVGGLPIITEVSPGAGPTGQYLTIMGANFGNNIGVIYFDDNNNQADGYISEGDFSFPAVCSDTWFNDHIVVKVPDIAMHNYSIRLKRSSDNEFSNDISFDVNDASTGPQICAMSPNNGSVQSLTNFYGENFGANIAANSDIVFYNNKLVNTSLPELIWNDQQILNASVPLGAEAGFVFVENSAGSESNSLMFDVASCVNDTSCAAYGTDWQCCEGSIANYCTSSCETDNSPRGVYSWQVDIEDEPFGPIYNYSCDSGLQSPSPWPDGRDGYSSVDAYLDTNLVIQFNQPIFGMLFMLDQRPKLFKCESERYNCTTDIPISYSNLNELYLRENGNLVGFNIPLPSLEQDTWYQVVLFSVGNESGAQIWAPDLEEFEWYFKTRVDNNICEVANVSIIPQSPVADMYPGQTRDFTAFPLAENCNVCGGDYNWTWDLNYDGGAASSYASYEAGSPSGDTARLIAGPGSTELTLDPNFITLQATEAVSESNGQTKPVVLAPVLNVVGNQPTCDDSCANATVIIDFNTAISRPVHINDMGVFLCDDDACNSYDDTTNYANGVADSGWVDGVYRVELAWRTDLSISANSSYKVIIRTAVINEYGYNLDEDYSWTFAVGDGNCALTGVNISPSNYITYNTNNITYRAYPEAENGMCGTQAINCDSCVYDWSTSKASLATIETEAKVVALSPLRTGNLDVEVDINGGEATANTSLSIDLPTSGEGEVILIDHNPGAFVDGAGVFECNNIAPSFVFDTSNGQLNRASVSNQINLYEDCDSGWCQVTGTTSFIETPDTTTVYFNPNSGLLNNYKTHRFFFDNLSLVLDGNGNSVTNGTIGTVWAPIVPGDTIDSLGIQFNTAADSCSIDSLDIDYDLGADTFNCIGDSCLDDAAITTSGNQHQYRSLVYGADGNLLLNNDSLTKNWASSNHSVITLDDTANTNVYATANSDGSADLDLEVYLNSETDNILNDRVLLQVSQEIPANAPEVLSISPLHDAPYYFNENICINVAPTIQFSELMDRQSIIDNIKIYKGYIGTLAIVEGNWSFTNIDFDSDGDLETQAIFNVSNPEVAVFDVSFGNADNIVKIKSLAGLSLGNSSAVLAYDWSPSSTLPDVYGWSYRIVNPAWCIIYDLRIRPSASGQDNRFTCVGNDCLGDENSSINGNQRLFTAVPISIAGETLSNADLSLDWTIIDSTLLSGVSLSMPIPDFNTDPFFIITPTGDKRGQTTLSAEGFDTNDPSNFIDGSAVIEVEICDYPWPSLDTYPWKDSDMNFSTFYCQYSGIDGDIVLLDLGDPQLRTPSDNPDLLREYITTLFYGTAVNNPQNYLGSLAFDTYIDDNKGVTQSWFRSITRLFNINEVQGQTPTNWCSPPMPSNFSYQFANQAVYLSWEIDETDSPYGLNYFDRFEIERQGPGDTAYQLIATLTDKNIRSYIDTNVSIDNTYNYKITTFAGGAGDCGPNTYGPTDPLVVNLSTEGSLIDIIGFRVMKNDEHLSVSDWYAQNAPNPNQAGSLIEVDGYEALQVGGTTYIAATNIDTTYRVLYTNIYIIAHNIDARSNTIEIYNQMLDNFKLNINLSANLTNTCNEQPTNSCSSDFDCPSFCETGHSNDPTSCEANGYTWIINDYCNSQGDKLRRDTKRLSDLVSIKKRIDSYGATHKSCDNNTLISCNSNSECPSGGACVSSYPLLNSGTYLTGITTSKWPSWSNAFSSSLGINVPTDPINLFNGCEDPYNPDTCWDEQELEFACPNNSLVYMYSIADFGQTYSLDANFEYGTHGSPEFDIGFSNLSSSIDNIKFSIVSCDASTINAPGAASVPYCGNGLKDSNYCTVQCPNCNAASCVAVGGEFITTEEECDGGFKDFQCKAILDVDWWNEQRVGCNPPGTLNASGDLIECTWYEPDPSFTAAQCGGWCGDGTVQGFYEDCEGASALTKFACATGDTLSCTNCQAVCTESGNATPDYPASVCGDGIWEYGIEQCDASGNPNGSYGWDCTEGGVALCNDSCEIYCTTGAFYEGSCGDGIVQSPDEECDYADYSAPLPEYSSNTANYTCSPDCLFEGNYCGDGEIQSSYGEDCDFAATNIPPVPLYSDELNQYSCRNSGAYIATDYTPYRMCTRTLDGWCGDGEIQSSYGEDCDRGAPWDGINPAFTNNLQGTGSDNQYECNTACDGTIGGWCGDGTVQTDYEDCDFATFIPPTAYESGTIFQNDNYDPRRFYTCNDDTTDLPCNGNGGWCGDGTVQSGSGEICDDGSNNGIDGCSIGCQSSW